MAVVSQVASKVLGSSSLAYTEAGLYASSFPDAASLDSFKTFVNAACANGASDTLHGPDDRELLGPPSAAHIW
jgi:hypothetical protein